MARAVVIGAGIAGLATACLLAEAGHQVTVLEQHTVPGGLIQRYSRGGTRFDTGLHFLSDAQPGGLLRRIAHRLGIRERLDLLEPDGQGQWRIAGDLGVEGLPAGITEIEQHWCGRFPAQAGAIGDCLLHLRGTMAATPGLDLGATARPQERDHDQTVRATLDGFALPPVVDEAMARAAGILGLRAEDCPWPLYAAVVGTALQGSWRVRGGGDAIVDALLARLARLGGRCLTGHTVTRIVRSDQGRATGISTADDDHHTADLVVAACDPRLLPGLAGPDALRPAARKRLAAAPGSMGAILVAARLHSPAPLGRRHWLFRTSAGHDAYAVAPDAFEPERPPVLEALSYIPVQACAPWLSSRFGRRPAEYERWKAQRVDELLSALEAQAPGTVELIERQWSGSPCTIAHYIANPDGAAFAADQTVQHFGRIPLNPRTRIPNLFLANANVGHLGVLGGLVGACMVAGVITGRPFRDDLELCAVD